MKRFVTPFRVGLLVLIAGGCLMAFILFTRKGGMGKDEAMEAHAYFRDASGLGTKSRIQIAGIPVGEVTGVTLEGTRAKVTVRVRRDVVLHQDAALIKRSESLLGDYLLDLNPGTEMTPPLKDGEEIRKVVDVQGMEAAFASLSQITEDIQQVTGALRDVLGGEKGAGSLGRIVDNMVRLSDSVDMTVRTSSERLDSILRNFEGVSKDVRGMTHSNEESVGHIVKNIEVITQDTREVLVTVRQIIGSGEGDLKDSVSSLKKTMERLDRSLANIEEVTAKVKNGEGAVGTLLSDERLGQKLAETVEDVSSLASTLTGLQTEVGLQATWLTGQETSKNSLSVRLAPRPDKYYLLEVVDDPRGITETIYTQTNPPSSGEPVLQQQKITRQGFTFSAQFAKRYYFTTLRFGIIESTGGVGADFHFFKDHLMLRLDAFNFSVDELRYPRIRTSLRAQAFDRIFVTVGMDDLLNAPQRDINTRRMLAGRDFFFGGGLYFTDDDLKALLPVLPTP
ncbi:Mammalian cell entry related domain protein [Cystobacter fuscus DSM 2262]|uniref:Mammalian cell entry related domain protein n=1 Tax=Cystobacter fuscus (strain ATCC 25194 / DSM 2262 / NBRC 100088 / M29) TaxID=1242864 RepID=S9NWU3_CYSF2|nr:MlaD family protein [Cystobacter fuscus]EPX56650.1 Mammalian cell entry related domain protein [Cystobacter fuscus DSM 2262]